MPSLQGHVEKFLLRLSIKRRLNVSNIYLTYYKLFIILKYLISSLNIETKENLTACYLFCLIIQQNVIKYKLICESVWLVNIQNNVAI